LIGDEGRSRKAENTYWTFFLAGSGRGGGIGSVERTKGGGDAPFLSFRRRMVRGGWKREAFSNGKNWDEKLGNSVSRINEGRVSDSP